ncbi:MAG: Ig-like domain-containing protein [Gemmatimonadetes bacterium]|nr:Ig-like domain-containing protein [Gemmatimonadota bacterium]
MSTTFRATASHGAASKLAFVTQPGGGTAATAWGTQPVVKVQDKYDNLVPSSASITVALTTANGAALTCSASKTKTATNGQVAFSGCHANKAGRFTLTATSGALTPAVSDTFSVAVAALDHFAVTATNGTALGEQYATTPFNVKLVAQDAGNNTVTGFEGTVSVTASAASGGALTGSPVTSGSFIAGVLSAQALTFSTTGTGVTIGVSGGTPAKTGTSATFAVSADPAKAISGSLSSLDFVYPSVAPGQKLPFNITLKTIASGNPTWDISADFTATISAGGGTLGSFDCSSKSTCTNTLTAPTAKGSYTLTVKSLAGVDFTNSPATFEVVGATAYNIAVNGGSAQSAPAGTAVTTKPSVLVTDSHDNPVPGQAVTFVVTTGGGSVTDATVTTNSIGIATVGSWTLGATAGANILTATTAASHTSAVTFSATGTVGAAAKLAFSVQPGDVLAHANFSPALAVVVQDAAGNTVTGGEARTVTLALTVPANTGACTNATPQSSMGVASFADCWVDLAGSYSLTVTSPSLTAAVSSTFTVSAAAASTIAIQAGGTSQTAGVRAAVGTLPSVIVKDAYNNPKAGVSVSFGVASGGGSVTGGSATTDASGIATVGSWTLGDVAGANTLTASSGTLTGSPLTFEATGTAGAATKLAFTVQPGGGSSQSAWNLQPVVTLQDAGGNTVTSSATVTLTITTPAGATLVCTSSAVDATNGVATFAGCKIDKAATGYTLTATSGALTKVSSTFTVTAASASQMTANAGGTTAIAGVAVSPAPSVIVKDASDNPVAGQRVTFAVTSGDGSVTSATDTTKASGIATVGSWILGPTVGTSNNTLTASSTGLADVTFTATGTEGAGSTLVFTTQPNGGAAGTVWSAQPVVTVRDANGNTVTSSSASITLAITTPNGATLTCTSNPAAAVNGVATFAGCKIDKAGTGYTLTASGTNLTSVTSSAFNVTIAAATTIAAVAAGNGQSAIAGAKVATAPSVLVTDAGGNGVAGVNVTFAVASGGGSLIDGTATTNASGIATLGSWTLGVIEGANTLTATSATLTGSPVIITATGTFGAATQLAFTTQPSDGNVGVVWGTQPAVTARDANGNTDPTFGSSVITLAITTPDGATLVCTNNPDDTHSGVVSFAGCKTNKAGLYTLTASADGLTSATSSAFTVEKGPPLTINKYAGDTLRTPVGGYVKSRQSARVTDEYGNPVSGISVTFAVASGGGSAPDGSVVTDAAGIATIGGSGWKLGPLAGANTLTATSEGRTNSPLTFTAQAMALEESVSGAKSNMMSIDSTTTVGSEVTIQLDLYNLGSGDDHFHEGGFQVSSRDFKVTATGGTVSHTWVCSGATCTGKWTAPTTVGTYVLTFKSLEDEDFKGGVLKSPHTIKVTRGPASQLTRYAGTSQSATAGSAVSTTPVAKVADQYGNAVPDVTVTFAVTGGSGSIGSLTATTDANGLASVGSWTLGTAAGTNTITATVDGLSGSPVTFTATGTAGAATQIAINAGDGQSVIAGAAVSTAPSVIVKDANGNPKSGASVTFAVASGGGSITGVTATTNASGIATVGSWTLGVTAGANTLTATSGVLSGSPVTISATATTGAAAKLAFTTQPLTGTGGVVWGTQPVVTVQDAQGNTVTSSASIRLWMDPSGTLVSPGCTTNPLNAVNGVATFSGCVVARAGSYGFRATATALPMQISNDLVVISVGPLHHFTITYPDTAYTTTAFTSKIVAKDAGENTVTSFTGTVSITASGATLADAPVTSGSFTAGVLKAQSLTFSTTGTGVTLSVSDGAKTGTSEPFTVTTDPAKAISGTKSSLNFVYPTVVPGQKLPFSMTMKTAANGNPTWDVSSAFTAATSGGTLGSFDCSSKASCTNTLTAPTTKGSYTLTVKSLADENFINSPATFQVVGATAYDITINLGNTQSAAAGTAVTAPSVLVTDSYGNPVPSQAVTFAVTTGGGSVTQANATTDANGIATVGSWTLGATAGANRLTATTTASHTSAVTFTATGTSRWSRCRTPKATR